jgi:hypothetical protein
MLSPSSIESTGELFVLTLLLAAVVEACERCDGSSKVSDTVRVDAVVIVTAVAVAVAVVLAAVHTVALCASVAKRHTYTLTDTPVH